MVLTKTYTRILEYYNHSSFTAIERVIQPNHVTFKPVEGNFNTTTEVKSKKVLTTDLSNDKETWSERQESSETGNAGKKGKDGSENKIRSEIEYTIITESSLFSIFKERNSLSLKEKEDSTRIRERNIPGMIYLIEKDIIHAAIQNNKLSNLRVQYPALLNSKNFDSLVTDYVILADQSIHAYRIRQESLRDDLKK